MSDATVLTDWPRYPGEITSIDDPDIKNCPSVAIVLSSRDTGVLTTNLACGNAGRLLPSANFSGQSPSTRAALFTMPCLSRNATVPFHTPLLPPLLVTVNGTGIASFVLLCSICASGCSNIASQAANVEGVRLYQQGNYQQASDRFQQAIAQDPKSPDGYYNLAASLHKTGTLYGRSNDLQQAENLYNQCLERDPNHTAAYRGLAVLLTETDRQRDAFNLLNHWSAASPKSADPKVELARLLEEVGQTEQAKAQLVDALTVDPHNARALTALGRLRDQSGDHLQAQANYERSLALNRFQPEVAARLAQLQGAAGAPVSTAPSAEPPTVTGWQPPRRY